MSHRQVLEALSGLLLGMFVSILAGTVVSTSLPKIIADLKGDQTAYTWVVVATLLATTVTTPIWGKLSDLFNRKLLIQLALAIFVIGSALAGFSQDTTMLIGFRVLQGVGAGGLTALSQVIMADIISPRERGKYMGIFGAIMAIGTVGGPLIGGLLTDSVGWRWNFYVGVPFAILAIILLQVTLHLPKRPKAKVSIDYLGAVLIAAGVSILLIWVSLAGQQGQFAWASATSFWMVAGAAVALIAAVLVELKVKDPVIPMRLFKNRTFTFSVIASISVGVAMFGTSVFLGQYMQLARGATPTQSGLLTLPMIAGLLVSSVVIGQIISRTGKWKAFMVVGSVLLIVGLVLMGTIDYDTDYVVLSVYMFVLGCGVGMVMQNLVLVVQNVVAPAEMGVASSAVTFFRSLGGTAGVSVLGSILGTQVADHLADKGAELTAAIMKLGPSGLEIAKSLKAGTIPSVSSLPESIRVIVESAYGESVAFVFLVAVPLAVVTLVAVCLLPNNRLGSKTTIERLAEENAAAGSGIDSESVIAAAAAEVIDDAEALIAAEPLESAEAIADAHGARRADSESGEHPSL
ncbi:MDR family MFS transporter [Humibacter ginsenosidimutans]|uniref:MFS transporter n=1 Tax=Humibacter ginsenosidimutans TaxID=2599293 RepID=A0A5B8M8C1_9MICO|nr:MDR family MFS transporter [Humibacter ginsenosidimutans]QDZ16968.1 MFS transporter [Humibacter ginsenosidimutans]